MAGAAKHVTSNTLGNQTTNTHINRFEVFEDIKNRRDTRQNHWTQMVLLLGTTLSCGLLQENTIDKGDFTVESDRAMVVKLGEMAVEHKLQNLSDGGQL